MTNLLAIDQGTTSTRAIVFSNRGKVLAQHQIELQQHFPKQFVNEKMAHQVLVEHDALEILAATQSVCRKAIAQAGVEWASLAGIGITNQRETVLIWDRKSGQPIHRAIVWQDRRTSDRCAQLKAEGIESLIQSRTGLLADPYFSATKIQWLLDQYDPERKHAGSGDWAVGTIDCYLVWALTGGKSHVTDATNASRTMLFNIHTQSWDPELLKLFNVSEALLPDVVDCAGQLGKTDPEVFGVAVPITGIAGDQQAALVGQACFEPGMVKSTYGTGCFMMMNTGTQPVASTQRLLTTIGYRLEGQVYFALEGSIFIAGAVMQWLRDGLKLIKHAKDSEAIAKAYTHSCSVVFVPAFAGLGAPYWDPQARGAIFGLTRATKTEDLVVAALESVAFQSRDLLLAMQTDAQQNKGMQNTLSRIRVDGGMVANQWLMQTLSDILQMPVDCPSVLETTALGVACLAGLGAGVLPNLDSIADYWQRDKDYAPQLSESECEGRYHRWLQAVEQTRAFG